MAKEPAETTHRFRIFAETSSEEMGPLLAKLTIMGLQNIGYELVTDVRTFAKRQSHDISMTEALLKYMEEHPTFAISDVIAHFKPEGRTSGAVYTAARTLIAAKKLRRLDAGNYQATHVKALSPPKGTKIAKGKRTRSPSPGKYDIPNHRLIDIAIRGRKRFTVDQMKKVLVDQGRSATSASPIISLMQKQRRVKMISPGEYEVLPKREPKPVPKKKNHSMNGAAAPAEVSANG